MAQTAPAVAKSEAAVYTYWVDTPAMILRLPADVTGGTNAGGLAYHPLRKIYYSAMAGNAAYPIVTFDSRGKWLATAPANADLRGIWYNTTLGRIEANLYPKKGWAYYETDTRGTPFKLLPINSDSLAIYDVDACPVYDSKNNQLIYLDYDYLLRYNAADGKYLEETQLDSEYAVEFDFVNTTSPGYTGRSQEEIALLDAQRMQVLLFDIANGRCTGKITFKKPPTSGSFDRFNFAVCNNMFWLFDVTKREWRGYKLPQKR